MSNPYESPTIAPVDDRLEENRRIWIALVPFAIAVVAIPVAIAAWFWKTDAKDSAPIIFGIAGAVLVFDLPVCALVIIEWLKSGHPPPLSLWPLVPSREEREFRRRLRTRPPLDDEAFFQQHFAESRVPRELPGKLRATLEDIFGLSFAALDPDDNLAHADWEMDWADVLDRIEEDFQISFPADSLTEIVTFRWLVGFVAEAIKSRQLARATTYSKRRKL
jgi:hypothetical protein